MKTFVILILSTVSAASSVNEIHYNSRPDFPAFDRRVTPNRCGSDQGRDGIYNPEAVRACIGTDDQERRILIVQNASQPKQYYLLGFAMPATDDGMTFRAFSLNPRTLSLDPYTRTILLRLDTPLEQFLTSDRSRITGRFIGFYASIEFEKMHFLPTLQKQFQAKRKRDRICKDDLEGNSTSSHGFIRSSLRWLFQR